MEKNNNLNIEFGAIRGKIIDGVSYVKFSDFAEIVNKEKAKNEELSATIEELEKELEAKEELLKIATSSNSLDELLDEWYPFIADEDEELDEEEVTKEMSNSQKEFLDNRIAISRLEIAVGVLAEQYTRLREAKGL